MVERGFARDPVTPWNLKDRPAALGSKRIGLDLRWLRLAPLCCWPGLPSEFETDFANALGALCDTAGTGLFKPLSNAPCVRSPGCRRDIATA